MLCDGKQTYRVLKMENLYMCAINTAIVCGQPTVHNDALRPGFVFTDPSTQRIEVVNYGEFEWDDMMDAIHKRNDERTD